MCPFNMFIHQSLLSSDPGYHQPSGSEALRSGGRPQRLWENQLGHDETSSARLEG